MDRTEKILHLCNLEGKGLEIGPSHSPVVPKSGGRDIETIDHLDREGLVQKYKAYGLDIDFGKIEEVDYVWQGGSYTELTGKRDHYDYIIASHLIEHTCDLIGFLGDCWEMLKEGGALSLAIPDKGYCFDYFRPVSGLGKVIDAHLAGPSVHTPGTLYEHFLYKCLYNGRIAWDDNRPGELTLTPFSDSKATLDAALKSEVYTDAHNWVFTKDSFQSLIYDLNCLGFIRFETAAAFGVSGCEFYISLRKTKEYITPDDSHRLRLLKNCMAESTPSGAARQTNTGCPDMSPGVARPSGANHTNNATLPRDVSGLSPVVSVIVPVYNGEKYLRQALESVLAQTHTNWELIIVDDGSTDSSPQIIGEFASRDSRVKAVAQGNAGQSSARNRAAGLACGEYLSFLDQDDYYMPRHLEYLAEYMDSHEDVGMAYNDAEVVDENGRRIFGQGASPFPPEHSPPRSIFECIGADLMILPGTVMIRRRLFLEENGFDAGMVGHEDDHLFTRLFLKNKFGRTGRAGLFYRMHGENTSRKAQVMCKSRLQYYEKLRALLPDKHDWNFSAVISIRFTRSVLHEYHRLRRHCDRPTTRMLYDSYKTVSPKTWKFRAARPFLHPSCPYFLYRWAFYWARRLRVVKV